MALYRYTVCSSLPLNMARDSNITSQDDHKCLTNSKTWLKYLWHDIWRVFQCLLHTRYNLDAVFYSLHKISDLRLQSCSISPFRHLKLCGSLSVSVFTRPNEIQHWNIQVHPTFMVNLTISHAYVLYSDGCTKSSIQVQSKEHVWGKFCGHVLYQNVFINSYSLVIYISTRSTHAVSLNAEYQVLDKDHIREINDKSNITFHNLNISVPDTPSSVLHKSCYLEFLWYYAYPAHPDYIRYSISTHDIIVSTDFMLVSLLINTFKCADEGSRLQVSKGLLPRVWLNQPGGGQLSCNGPRRNISVMEHPFFSVFLKVNIADYTTEVDMKFHMSATPILLLKMGIADYKLDGISDSGLPIAIKMPRSHVESSSSWKYPYVKVYRIKYFNVTGLKNRRIFFNLKFLKFKYTGYNSNMQDSGVIWLSSKKHHKAQFPKGNFL